MRSCREKLEDRCALPCLRESSRAERWGRWRRARHRKQPRADLSKYRPEGQPKTTRWRAPNNRPGESGEQECAWSDQQRSFSRRAPESCTTPLSAGPEAG